MSERRESHVEIFAVQFDEESAIFNYMHVPTDVRANGNVALQHTARLDLVHPDYAEDAETLRRICQRMLNNALDDFNNSEPWVPEDEDEEDDDRGMGDG